MRSNHSCYSDVINNQLGFCKIDMHGKTITWKAKQKGIEATDTSLGKPHRAGTPI